MEPLPTSVGGNTKRWTGLENGMENGTENGFVDDMTDMSFKIIYLLTSL